MKLSALDSSIDTSADFPPWFGNIPLDQAIANGRASGVSDYGIEKMRGEYAEYAALKAAKGGAGTSSIAKIKAANPGITDYGIRKMLDDERAGNVETLPPHPLEPIFVDQPETPVFSAGGPDPLPPRIVGEPSRNTGIVGPVLVDNTSVTATRVPTLQLDDGSTVPAQSLTSYQAFFYRNGYHGPVSVGPPWNLPPPADWATSPQNTDYPGSPYYMSPRPWEMVQEYAGNVYAPVTVTPTPVIPSVQIPSGGTVPGTVNLPTTPAVQPEIPTWLKLVGIGATILAVLK